METKKEQALVGLFVIVAAGLLLVTVFAISGAFVRAGATYRTYFKFAGGLQPGATVRYAGGPKVGRVERVRVDPSDPTRIEIGFSVLPGTPVKTDSVAKVASLSALGDNYLELSPGTATAPPAPPGSALKSAEYVGFADLTAKLNQLGPTAQELLENLNDRVTELRETIARVNDLLNTQNRANVAMTLGDIHGMLAENRPKLKSTMTQIDAASAKLPPLLDDLKKTLAQADNAVSHIDATITENRPDLRESIRELRQTLASASNVTDQLDRTLSTNAENIDEILENFRHVSENLKEFTATIKTRPYTLIRGSGPPARHPGERASP